MAATACGTALPLWFIIMEKIAMEIGGRSKPATMHKIYTHITQNDIQRYKSAMAEFYDMKTPDKNRQASLAFQLAL